MWIDSDELITKLPAMIQGRKTFTPDGDYHRGPVEDWCLRWDEVEQGIKDFVNMKDTGNYTYGAPVCSRQKVYAAI